jgi:protein TonB
MSMDLPVPRTETLVAPCPDDLRRRMPTRRLPAALWGAGVISVLLHLMLGTAIHFGVLPGRVKPSPDNQGTIELLMIENKGERAPASQPSPPQPVPNAGAPPTLPRDIKAEGGPSGRPTAPDDEAGEPVAPPAPSPEPEPASEEAEAKPSPARPDQPVQADQSAPAPKPQPALTFNLQGSDSLSTAEAMGEGIIPASPDDRFRNRPPIYPREAAARGEHGAVTLLIHVSDRGLTTGADVIESSGHPALDEAALEAVRKWHFRPGLKDGKAVPFDMPMRFIFEVN